MKITKKTAEFIAGQNFKLFMLSIFRADGKVEQPTISIKGDWFTFSNELWSESKPIGTRYEISYPIHELKRVLTTSFNDLKNKDYKRITFGEGENCVFMDIWEK